jgi:hypothetical protein
MAKAIHTEGFKAPIYDKAMVDYIGQTQNWLFEERIDWICQVLRVCSSYCITPNILLTQYAELQACRCYPHGNYPDLIRSMYIAANAITEEREELDYGWRTPQAVQQHSCQLHFERPSRQVDQKRSR